MPADPATSHTDVCHLWPLAGRAGSQARRSPASTRWADAPLTSRPMSATATSPASAGPSPSRRPGLSAANVTVAVAASGRPLASPVSPLDAGRDVDGEHQRVGARLAATERGRCEVATEAGSVGGVDDEVGGRKRRGCSRRRRPPCTAHPAGEAARPPPARRCRCCPSRRARRRADRRPRPAARAPLGRPPRPPDRSARRPARAPRHRSPPSPRASRSGSRPHRARRAPNAGRPGRHHRPLRARRLATLCVHRPLVDGR